jgi:uncharacterized membrane protein YeaQ/YmgE (transglycosylase-associated protein family)
VDVEISGFFSAIGVGIVCGLIGRMFVRSYASMGCIVTIVLGIAGASIGLWLGEEVFDWDSFWLVFLLQIVISAIITGIFITATGRKNNMW